MLLTAGGFCSLCYWMLRGWTTPGWALAGGLLAIIEFGPLNQWMNTYWANAIPALAGCLVFGAVGRGSTSLRNGVLLGLGLATHLVTRPFEAILLLFSVAWFLPRVAKFAVLPLLPAVLLLACQNRAVTGSWTTMPYMLSQWEYGSPTSFAFQPVPTPHRSLTPEQELNYRAQSAIHGDRETLWSYLERLGYRVRYFRFFLLPPLYLAVIAFLATIRDWRSAWVIAAVLIFVLGSNLYPYFYPHYVGATANLFVLMSVAGLDKLDAWKPHWGLGRMLVILCTVQFLFWYGIRVSGQEALFPALSADEWDFVNFGDPEGRIAINKRLVREAGKQLVFVHYAPSHRFHEWIHNDADIDAARVVWALDLGEAENAKLVHYYGDRKAWVVEPDAQPPTLRPY
jgi:hypothetical protein